MIDLPLNQKVQEAFLEIGTNCRVSPRGAELLTCIKNYLLEHGPISRKQLNDEPPFKQFYPSDNFTVFFGEGLVERILEPLIKRGLVTEDDFLERLPY